MFPSSSMPSVLWAFLIVGNTSSPLPGHRQVGRGPVPLLYGQPHIAPHGPFHCAKLTLSSSSTFQVKGADRQGLNHSSKWYPASMRNLFNYLQTLPRKPGGTSTPHSQGPVRFPPSWAGPGGILQNEVKGREQPREHEGINSELIKPSFRGKHPRSSSPQTCWASTPRTCTHFNI